MDRAKAKSMTRTVQIFAVALVAAAGLAAVVPLNVRAEPITTDAPPPTPKPQAAAAPKIELETTTAALSLNTVSGPVKNQPAPPPPGGDEQTQPQVVKTGVDAWRYLGGIISSTYKRAIVVVESGEQRLLAEGQTLNDVEIVQIDKAFVKVKQGETETTINLAPRQKPVLTVLDPAAAGRVNNPGMQQQPNINNPGMSRASISGNGANGASALNAKSRQRDLQRMKDDAKARGDEKGAEMIETEMSGKGGSEKGGGEKGQK